MPYHQGKCFIFLRGISTRFDLENFEVGSTCIFEMMISYLTVPEYKLVLYHGLLCMLLTEA